jgi:preprotein translocase subunit SecD
MARGPRALLLLGFVLLLVAGCGSSRPSCSDVILRAVPEKGRQITAADMQLAQQIIEQRVNTLGVTSPKVSVHGDEIVIQLTGVHRPARIANLAATPGGKLQIFDFEPSLAPPTVTGNQRPAPMPSLYRLLAAVQSRADQGAPQAYYLFNRHHVVQGPAPTLQQLFSPYKGKQPAHTAVLKVPANTEPVWCAAATGCPGAGSNGTSKGGKYWYLFKAPAQLTGKDLVSHGIAADVDPSTGRPLVLLQFTKHGSHEFQAITKAEYSRGRVDAGEAGQLGRTNPATVSQYAGHNAIVLDGQLKETPFIDYTQASLADGIVGNAEITEPSKQAAQRTALVLKTGSLPFGFEQVKLSGCAR